MQAVTVIGLINTPLLCRGIHYAKSTQPNNIRFFCNMGNAILLHARPPTTLSRTGSSSILAWPKLPAENSGTMFKNYQSFGAVIEPST
jgi:hypothetical protein